jgi:hypothetical protein
VSGRRILYLGEVKGTCLDRANALRRLGHEVLHLDLREWLPSTVWVDRVTWRVGGHVFGPWLARQIRHRLASQRFDLVHVDNGEYVGPPVLKALRQLAPRVINYNIDDPTGPRDRQRFEAYRRALPGYDLVSVVRLENVAECLALGARHVLRVWRSADEVNHAPRPLTDVLARQWQTDVLFLGTWMPERGVLLKTLLELGVPISIRGSHWQKAPEWSDLASCWLGGALSGDDYALALQCARVNLGLVSLGNRDQHTTRSLEIPALGGLLCAQRTLEHAAMYEEGREALFWDDARECADQILRLLADEPGRQQMAKAGHERYLRNRHGNEDVMQQLLDEAWRRVP